MTTLPPPEQQPPSPQTRLWTQINKLNPSQRQGVETTEGPVLILAGAGTGKTTVLTTRLAYLALEKQCSFSHMLAVTFTNKAANEMKQRLNAFFGGDDTFYPWVGTFHHIGLKICRRYHDLLGLPPRFLIMDNEDQLRLLKQVMKARQIDEKAYPPKLFSWAIGRLKDRALEPHQVTPTEATRLLGADKSQLLISLYTDYQQALHRCGGADFGDLILLCLKLFREHPDILHSYQKRFRYLLVDEYQDINVAQYVWLRLLAAGERPHICCVGDDDQSIYGWRGAEVDHILKFEQDFHGTTLIKLEDNYRSTSSILHAASGLIDHNKGRLGKTLRAAATHPQEEKVRIKSTTDDRSEARFIAHDIHTMLSAGHKPTSIAVLVRATFQTRAFEEALLGLGIPYRLVGSTRFYERLEIKDAVAYVKLMVNPTDNLAFERALSTPKRGVGATTLQKLYAHARMHNLSLWESLEDCFTGGGPPLTKSALAKLIAFVTDIKAWQALMHEETPSKIAEHVLEKSGYMQHWRHAKGDEAQGRLENLRELLKVLTDFSSLDEFLEHISLVTDNTKQETQEAVQLMTLHTAKGLEFDTVFLPGWEENIFPHPKALEESGDRGLEEERRLAYVGITRAKRKATITYAQRRSFFGGGWQPSFPSRFLDELPATAIEHEKRMPYMPSSRTPLSASQATTPPFLKTGTPLSSESGSSSPSEGFFAKGTPVLHKAFGEGVVVKAEGPIIVVDFVGVGVRKIMARFLEKK
ncbi:ATP-dependent helicase [Candidatus Hepatobacter penaei]|uniref:ATP-dependent helicase n=1 Tax=Candidatus Hepatobacter penaei TaxID=1274402 RepID=UPI0004F2B067|nr:UvrD-helicase domain-containing protein [Candidatus Hepatobacter penaei]